MSLGFFYGFTKQKLYNNQINNLIIRRIQQAPFSFCNFNKNKPLWN